MASADSGRWPILAVVVVALVLAPATASVGAADGHGTSIPVDESEAAPDPENVTVEADATQAVVGDGPDEALVFDSGGTGVDFATDCGSLDVALDVSALPQGALTDETEVDVELADEGGFLGGLFSDDQFELGGAAVDPADRRVELAVEVNGCETGDASALAVDAIELSGLDLSNATPGQYAYETGAYFENRSDEEGPDDSDGAFDDALAADVYGLATFSAVDTTDPEADAGEDASATAGEKVTFDGSGSSDDVAIDSYEWDVDDDGSYELSGATPSHAFEAPGSYPVELRVTDESDNTDTDSVTVSVEAADENEPPTVDPIGDRSLAEGETATVDVSAADPDGDPVELSLANAPAFASLEDRGDGTATLTLAPGQGDAGEHTVSVHASDGNATANASATVTVTSDGSVGGDGGGDGGDSDGDSTSTADEGDSTGTADVGDSTSTADGDDSAGDGGDGGDAFGGSDGDGGDGQGGLAEPEVVTSRQSPNRVAVEVDGLRAEEPTTVRLPPFEGEAGAGTQLAGFVLRPAADGDVELSIERAGAPPDGTPPVEDAGSPLAYYAVDHDVSPVDVDSVRLGFRIEKSRLDAAGVDPGSVSVYRYEDDGWARYEATRVDEDDDAYYYTATVPGFSRYAVVADAGSTEAGDTGAGTEPDDTAAEPDNTAAGPDAADPASTEVARPTADETAAGGPIASPGGLGIDVLAVLGVVLVLFGVGYYGSGPLYERFRRP